MLLISLALLASSSTDPLLNADKVYMDCLSGRVKAYVPVAQKAQDAIDAAYGDCLGERGALLKAWLGDQPVTFKQRQGIEETLNYLDDDRRNKLLAVYMRARIAKTR